MGFLKTHKVENLTGDPLRFFTSVLLQNVKKMKRDPLETSKNNKSHSAEKKSKGRTLQSRPLWYVTLKRKI